jgi:prepilin-type N-terminal cleavage/methylation domain-containing protein
MRKNKRSTQQGFTLVEMAVVLVIIGLILGAVMIGKDVQRNAEYARVKQKFVDQWAVAYNAYHQRTGAPLADSQIAPRLMINGANFDAGTGAPISGGNMTGTTPPGAICQGGAAAGMGRTVQTGDEFQLRFPASPRTSPACWTR